ncbi:hypothetical protein H4R23_002711 [Coemansia sp. Cherry 401B]|nr:hypothetical protein H4R23_002711 [Coemansia sp. Cherry 401B]
MPGRSKRMRYAFADESHPGQTVIHEDDEDPHSVAAVAPPESASGEAAAAEHLGTQAAIDAAAAAVDAVAASVYHGAAGAETPASSCAPDALSKVATPDAPPVEEVVVNIAMQPDTAALPATTEAEIDGKPAAAESVAAEPVTVESVTVESVAVESVAAESAAVESAAELVTTEPVAETAAPVAETAAPVAETAEPAAETAGPAEAAKPAETTEAAEPAEGA